MRHGEPAEEFDCGGEWRILARVVGVVKSRSRLRGTDAKRRCKQMGACGERGAPGGGGLFAAGGGADGAGGHDDVGAIAAQLLGAVEGVVGLFDEVFDRAGEVDRLVHASYADG